MTMPNLLKLSEMEGKMEETTRTSPEFPHAMLNGIPTPIMLCDIFSIDGLPVTLQYPSAMTREDFVDFEAWLHLVLSKAKRWSAAYEKALANNPVASHGVREIEGREVR